MKLFQKDHIYNHPWTNVTLAFWRKYPNKYATHIKSVDTFHRNYNKSTGTYTTHRLITAESALPVWMKALGMDTLAYGLERTTVNNEEKKMVVQTRNFTGRSIVEVEETCTYTQDKTDVNRTHYRQEARITAFMPFVTSRVESFTYGNLAVKSKEGVRVMEILCERIKNGYAHLMRKDAFRM